MSSQKEKAKQNLKKQVLVNKPTKGKEKEVVKEVVKKKKEN